MQLWNDGQVMFYIGFPRSLSVMMEPLQRWLEDINGDALSHHCSIYGADTGYCGEAFYEIDREHSLARLNIKLLPGVQGKGIAACALSYTIDQVFRNNLATKAYVDPHPKNKNAWTFYAKLGFISQPRPAFLPQGPTYLEITRDTFTSAYPGTATV